MLSKLITRCIFLILIASFYCSCQRQPTPLLIISIRGTSAYYLDSLLENGQFFSAYFTKFYKNAQKASYLEPIENALTAVADATTETGASPEVHGIWGNAMLDEQGNPTSGFELPLKIPSIWEWAHTKGKQIIRIGALRIHGQSDQSKGIRTLGQGTMLTPGEIFQLKIDTLSRQNHAGFLPLQNVASGHDSLKFYLPDYQGDSLFFAFLADTSADGKSDFQGIILDTDQNPANGYSRFVNFENWTPISFQTENGEHCRTALRIIKKSQDRIELYLRPIFKNSGYPSAFVQEINQSLGATPGWANWGFFQAGKLSEAIVLEEIDLERSFLLEVAAYCRRQIPCDALFLDYPLIDRVGHGFYHDASAGCNDQPSSAFLQAYQQMDRDISNLTQDRRWNYLIYSAHGFAAVCEMVSLPNLLGVNENINIIANKTSARIFFKKNTINQDSLLQDWNNRLRPWTDTVFVKNNYIVLMARPGMMFTQQAFENNTLTAPPLFRGEHGYLPRQLKDKGVLFYAGNEKLSLDQKVIPAEDIGKIILQLLSN
ncbi:MAG: alkaline phosphatase family protein [Saprospiraceae bacterium]|nr:alkaline phosphatase family protein [Saprospiraceae bacterium]